MFENNLESLSRGKIKIFEIDGGLDIRNKDERKQVSPEDRQTLEEHLVGSDSGSFDDFLDGGVDVSGQPLTANSISVGSNQGVQGSVGFDPDGVEMTIETKDGKKVLGYAHGND